MDLLKKFVNTHPSSPILYSTELKKRIVRPINTSAIRLNMGTGRIQVAFIIRLLYASRYRLTQGQIISIKDIPSSP